MVVGRATVLASKEAPHVMARPVPLSVKQIINVSYALGVPERLVVIEVIAVASPVKLATSVLSVLIVGVAPGAFTVTTRFVIRLLVSVTVAAFLVASEVLSTLPNPTSPLTIPVGVAIAGEVKRFATVMLLDWPADTSSKYNKSFVAGAPPRAVRAESFESAILMI